jgi:hypothetical protein
MDGLTASGPSLGLTRANLAEHTLATLKRGSWRGPDVLLVAAGSARVVVKDFGPRSLPVRAIWGRWSVRRELSVYRHLEGVRSVPRALGRLDPVALVLEHRAGTRISRRRPWTFDAEFSRRLEEAVREVHRRGVVHLDLAHRGNVLAAPDGEPVLLDFGAALAFRRGGLLARLLLPILARVDQRALSKWRRQLGAGPRAQRDSPAAPAAAAGADSEGGRGASRPT